MNPRFKVGDYVKQNPVGFVKKVIAVEPTYRNNEFCHYSYKLQDSIGWEPEFKLTLDKKENLTWSIQGYARKLERKILEQDEEIKRLKNALEGTNDKKNFR